MNYSIIEKQPKKNFKVWLDSNNANSFKGNQFDAHFFVDLLQCIREEEKLKSSYAMTFSFISKASTFAIGTVSSTNTYTVHIDLGKGTPSMFRFSSVRTPSGIVRVSTDGSGVYSTIAGVSDIPVYFNSKATDNDPVFIDNLLSISSININLIQSGSGTFNNANDTTINNATKYICCLNFQEL